MDLSKLSKGDKVFVGGALVFVIASFLNWFDAGGSDGLTGFDVGFLWCTLWFLALLAGALAILLPTFGVQIPKLPAVAFLAVGALATLFVVLKLLIGESIFTFDLSRAAGIYIAAIGAIAAAVGGFLKFQESGGDINDLKDMNKLKASFNQGGGGSTPPPPPPPPPPMS